MRKIDISVIKFYGMWEDEWLYVVVFGDIVVEEVFGVLVCNVGILVYWFKFWLGILMVVCCGVK